jgi:hypothetical protein
MWAAFVIGAFVAPLMVDAPPSYHHPKQRFVLTENGGGLGVEVENTVVFSVLSARRTTIWLVERNSNKSNWCGRTGNGQCIATHTSSMEWIDGSRCASLRLVLLQLEKVRTEERASAHPWVSDTPLVSFLTFDQGQLETQRLAEYVGPLVDWWQSAQQQLKPCWTKSRPPDL